MAEERILQIVLALTAVGSVLAAWAGRADRGRAPGRGGRHRPRAAASWPSTRSCSATPPTPTGAARSPSSRPASSSPGWWAPSSRWSCRIPMEIGFLVMALMAGFALFSYLGGLRALDRGQMPARRQWPTPAPSSSRSAGPPPAGPTRDVRDHEVDAREPRAGAPSREPDSGPDPGGDAYARRRRRRRDGHGAAAAPAAPAAAAAARRLPPPPPPPSTGPGPPRGRGRSGRRPAW